MFDIIIIIIIQEPTASTMDDSENNSHNVNAINLVENVSEASPDERPIGKIQIKCVYNTSSFNIIFPEMKPYL